MRVRYYPNRTGPVSLTWYQERNLLENGQIRNRYVFGRMDTNAKSISLPAMTESSWEAFSTWIRTYETDEIWSLKNLVWLYECRNPRIEWYEIPTWYDPTYDPTKYA